MAVDEMVCAVIPARGGSKRIPRKNIKPFLGIPLLVRTIALLREARLFDRIVVSTDDDEIAELAASAGAEVPFRRPEELSDDRSPTFPVVVHAIRMMEQRALQPSLVCCVYPAAVLTRGDDLRRAVEILRETSASYVFTATPYSYPIQRALRKTATGRCEMIWPEYGESRSQDLEPAFHDAGQFYFGRREAWLEQIPLFSSFSRMLIIPHYRAQDIDTSEDWKRAELVFELLERES
jgi:N-acylneuraminate cytidylyltransferase